MAEIKEFYEDVYVDLICSNCGFNMKSNALTMSKTKHKEKTSFECLRCGENTLCPKKRIEKTVDENGNKLKPDKETKY
jgi:Zn ribbon nucleic-acid-binding protein